MNLDKIRKEKDGIIKQKLFFLYKEFFRLRIEKSSGVDFKKGHLFKKNKKDIARILTVLREKK